VCLLNVDFQEKKPPAALFAGLPSAQLFLHFNSELLHIIITYFRGNPEHLPVHIFVKTLPASLPFLHSFSLNFDTRDQIKSEWLLSRAGATIQLYRYIKYHLVLVSRFLFYSKLYLLYVLS